MTKYIASTAKGVKPLINFEKSVTSISQVGTSAMNVSVRGESTPRTYSHVISTIPLTGLRTIDLSGAGLNVMQKTALRKLQYGPSIKIGMRFKSAWWTEKFGIVGGQSFTDLPIRTIVYPSYGVDSATPSTVLIASYCWTNDAERLGSLINTGKTEYTEQLKELVLRNLAEVHNMPYDDLINEYEDMHAWDWNHNPLTGGESVDVDGSQSFAHSFCHRCLCVLRARRFPGFVHVSHCTKFQQEIAFCWRGHEHPSCVSKKQSCLSTFTI